MKGARKKASSQSVSQSVSRVLLAVFILMAASAFGQTIPQGTFKHIIIIVQENRTPDNLFGASPMTGSTCGPENNPLLPGADIDNGGYGYYYDSVGKPHYGLICNTALPLNGWDANIPGYTDPTNDSKSIDPRHSYEDWEADFDEDGTLMSGFCHEFNDYSVYGGQCPSYSYVQQATVQPYYDGAQPYFDIATAYGFANYMFQTSEGPSQPAHQFLFTGTSAPDAPNQPYYFDFVADLPNTPPGAPVTCNATSDWPEWVQPDGTTLNPPPLDSECYTHDSLVTDTTACSNGGPDYCDRGVPGISSSIDAWGYYTEPSAGSDPQSIWDAPANIPEVCYGLTAQYGTGQSCGGGGHGSMEWSDHLRIPQGTAPWDLAMTYSWAPIFDDILNCELPAISWVTPDQRWSDHPWLPSSGTATSPAFGPYWVADIINAVGGQACNGKYWSGSEPTAVIVTWDDWGGWYDHVKPWAFYGLGSGKGYWNQNGND